MNSRKLHIFKQDSRKMIRVKPLVTLAFFMILIFGFNGNCRGQTPLNFLNVDSTTYSLYLQKDWKALLETGREAIRQDIDYFYLRMRIGIAYYEKQNYRRSIRHFKKAIDFNSGDPYVGEYLYYAYLLSGRTPDSYQWGRNMPATLQGKTGFQQNFISNTKFSLLYNKADNSDILSDYSSGVVEFTEGSQTFTREYNEGKFSFITRFGGRVSMFHSLSYMHKINFRYLQSQVQTIVNPGEKIDQFGYYGSLNILAASGFSIKPAVHYINIRLPEYTLSGGGNGPGMGGSTNINRYIQMNDYVVSIELSAHFSMFTISMATAWSDLNNNTLLQPSASLTYYPLGNLNLYGASTFSYKMDNFPEPEKEGYLIFSQSIGFRTFKSMWIDLEGNFGKMKNYISGNGYLVYNSIDYPTLEIGGTINYYIGRKSTNLFAGYYFQKLESVFVQDASLQEHNKLSYFSNLLIIGIKWKI